MHGAAGGTGFAAVQLAKALGARVLAVASGDVKCAFCRENGADEVIDRGKEDFVESVRSLTEGQGVDAVFDPVGGDTYLRSLDCIAKGGRLLAVGFASGAWADAPTARLVARNVSAVGVVAVAPSPEIAAQMHTRIMQLYTAGTLRPMIAREFAFEQLPDAIAQLEAGGVCGKQVIRVP